jgi:lysine-arginine-ornithine-binding protein
VRKIVISLVILGALLVGYYTLGSKIAPKLSGSNDIRVVPIGTEGAYAPFNFTDETGQLKGFDIEIAQAVCREAKLECTFSAQDWDGLIPGLLARKFDMIASSMSITDERAKAISFSDHYYRTPIRFVSLKDSTLVTTKEGLKGKKLGAQRATTSAIYLQENFDDVAEIKLYDTWETARLDLSAGRVDAILSDAISSWHWLQTPQGATAQFRGDTAYVDSGIGFGMRKNDTELLKSINEGLAAVIKSGEYEAINKKYFPFSIY